MGQTKSKMAAVGGVGEIFYGVDFYNLPEGCIATIVSFTSPRDACRLSSISKTFQSAAESDGVWEKFLPSDYREILAKSHSDHDQSFLGSLSKRQLFMHLANTPILFDEGTMSFSLDKSTGKKCYTIGARKLAIIWSGTPRYWAWHPDPKSRFSEVAELLNVCWLEITGNMRTSLLSPDTHYIVYLVFEMTVRANGFYSTVDVVLNNGEGDVKTASVYLGSRDWYRNVTRQEDDSKFSKKRSDGWHEVQIGEFSTRKDEDGQVEMKLMEVKNGNWKNGLVVEGIEIRPKML